MKQILDCVERHGPQKTTDININQDQTDININQGQTDQAKKIAKAVIN